MNAMSRALPPIVCLPLPASFVAESQLLHARQVSLTPISNNDGNRQHVDP